LDLDQAAAILVRKVVPVVTAERQEDLFSGANERCQYGSL
jgi:hypothetical protein